MNCGYHHWCFCGLTTWRGTDILGQIGVGLVVNCRIEEGESREREIY